MANLLKKAFKDMKESAKAQHEVDKANFKAVKAESRANFEANRGKNTFKKAKAIGKQSWDDAHLTIEERKAKTAAKQEEEIKKANERIAKANKKLEENKVN